MANSGMGQPAPANLRAYAASVTGSRGMRMGKPHGINANVSPQVVASNMGNMHMNENRDLGLSRKVLPEDEALPNWKMGAV